MAEATRVRHEADRSANCEAPTLDSPRLLIAMISLAEFEKMHLRGSYISRTKNNSIFG
jgi:hypothetical protein